MRFNILGFDQVKACEYGLTIDELMILRHMHDFASSGKMETLIVDGEMYYWIKYDKFISDLPILNMKKTRLMELFNYNLCEMPSDWEDRYNKMSASSQKRANSFKFKGILKNYTKKNKEGTFSYFAFTKKFYDLIPAITDNDLDNKKSPTYTEVEDTQKSKTNNVNKSIPHEKTNNNTKNEAKTFKPSYKTKFHNCNETFSNYSLEELEDIARNIKGNIIP